MQSNNVLIPIGTHQELNEVVFARELHCFLGCRTKFADWMKRMFEYGFEENLDYVLVSQKRETNNPKNKFTIETDYLLSLNCAKEIAMLQRTEKGKQVRRYFIACEKALLDQRLEAETECFAEIGILYDEIYDLKEKIISLEKSNEDNKFYANLWSNATAEMVKLCQKIADRKAKALV